ncbi:hypothetical protein [Corynebacterium hylobatis]|uniref:hypothetical protein n=1 Tax=Corynebacterium hylobatis TaxID=1859290 RepID=UPI001F496320|nr:hypothetical protein [Corynebacterium hylobatis]
MRPFPVVVVALIIVIVITIPLVVSFGLHREGEVAGAADVEKREVDIRPVTASGPDLASFVENPTGSQISFHRLSDDHRTGTATERFARPALSLIKLYIAEYVIEHGTFAEQYAAIDMISSSDDRTAGELYRKYPESIGEVAREYGLLSTRAHDRWGYSVTSTYDVVGFIVQLMEKDPMHPILVAMAEATPVAADGYGQDFGTSVLPGVIGTKWGWSDNRDLHSSVSFGENFVVAAAVTGSADDLTELVEARLADEVAAATGQTGS